MSNVYHGNWGCKEDVARDFHVEMKEFDGARVLMAAYHSDYEGTAFVLFERGEKMYEVHGSHCSCYGLEDQWEPSEVTIEELLFRLEKGECYYFFYEERELMTEILMKKLRRKIKQK